MEALNRHPRTTINAVARRSDPWLGFLAFGALAVLAIGAIQLVSEELSTGVPRRRAAIWWY